MAHPESVKAALAMLARGGPGRRARASDEPLARNVPEPSEPDYVEDHVLDAESVADAEVIIDTAERAFDDVERAADFLDEVGEDRLAEAVDRVREAGADDVTARGRRLLDDLEAYREAADCDGVSHDHFHPGRGTLLRGAGLAGDR